MAQTDTGDGRHATGVCEDIHGEHARNSCKACSWQVQSDGTAEPSIGTSLLADLDDRKDKARRERVIRSVLGTAYVGALLRLHFCVVR